MNRNLDQILDRFFRGAGMAPRERDTAMPYGFDNRVIARWNAGETPIDFSWIIPVARRVLSLSVAVMLVIVGVNWHRLKSSPVEEMAGQPYAAAMRLIK